ncbi:MULTISPECIES: beta-1,6-N-acetylglucosaminyltransferase [unclassified Sphingobacterium]|uniref:beta-1,6-N-acetylglucosaminyltransferase n=1 Tax=unclassified Sphingobacterium TaxID=2609468 RepID=UPI0025F35B56|nr:MULTISPECIES: beta-1,6-N-acetylglucosaminyltransferase [unclassified Sphingobacterium]
MVFLIIAHRVEFTLVDLIERLTADENSFVLHIDKTVDIAPFIELLKDVKSCYFLKDRYHSGWGTFGLIEATLSGLRYIRNHFLLTERIVLLSGACYPIKPLNYISKFLKSHTKTIFIDYHPIPRKIWYDGGIYRFPFYDIAKNDLTFFGGSQWFSIPNNITPIIFDFLDLNPLFMSYFRKVLIPDESFFQTLFLNCEHPIIYKNLKNLNLHFMKWDKPYKSPRILSLIDLKQIKRSKCLFARKFVYPHSISLQEHLDSTNIL